MPCQLQYLKFLFQNSDINFFYREIFKYSTLLIIMFLSDVSFITSMHGGLCACDTHCDVILKPLKWNIF